MLNRFFKVFEDAYRLNVPNKVQGIINDTSRGVNKALRMFNVRFKDTSNMHQGKLKDALIHVSFMKTFRSFNRAQTEDCSLSQLPSPNEGLVF